jgi:hypothetical protein
MTGTFVVGFSPSDPEGLTPIDIVSEITGLSHAEIKDVYETVEREETPEPDEEEHWSGHDYPEKDPEDLLL